MYETGWWTFDRVAVDRALDDAAIYREFGSREQDDTFIMTLVIAVGYWPFGIKLPGKRGNIAEVFRISIGDAVLPVGKDLLAADVEFGTRVQIEYVTDDHKYVVLDGDVCCNCFHGNVYIDWTAPLRRAQSAG